MIVDVIMLTNSADQDIVQMTQQAVNSLHASEDKEKVSFRVFLVESGHHTKYEGITDYNQPYFENGFNYNQAVNIGIRNARQYSLEYDDPYQIETVPPMTVIANNDLIFHPNWFSAIIKQYEHGYDSFSPKNPGWQFHLDIEDNKAYEGFTIGREFCGWCLVFTREALDELYPLDERFKFWCQDNDLAIQIKSLGMKHILVGSSHVTHLTSRSHRLIPPNKHHEFTHGMGNVLNEKYKNG